MCRPTSTTDHDNSSSSISMDDLLASMSSSANSSTRTNMRQEEHHRRRRRGRPWMVRFGTTQVYEHKVIHDNSRRSDGFFLTIDWECSGSYTVPAKELGRFQMQTVFGLSREERQKKLLRAHRSFEKPTFYSKFVKNMSKRIKSLTNDSVQQPVGFDL